MTVRSSVLCRRAENVLTQIGDLQDLRDALEVLENG